MPTVFTSTVLLTCISSIRYSVHSVSHLKIDRAELSMRAKAIDLGIDSEPVFVALSFGISITLCNASA
jgi:hypothetical protein